MRAASLFTLSIGVTALGCGDSTTPTQQQTQVVTTVIVTPAADTAYALGRVIQFGAEVRDQNQLTLTGRQVVWTSLDQSVATVDASSGRATAVGNGTASIRATVEGKSGTASLVVLQIAASIQLSTSRDTLTAINDTVTVQAVVQDSAGNAAPTIPVNWTSRDSLVAVPEPTGLVRALGPGTTQIVASAGTGVDSLTMTVRQIVTTLDVQPADNVFFIREGDTKQLVVTARDANGILVSNPIVTYAVADTSMAVVDSTGLVTATAARLTYLADVSSTVRLGATADGLTDSLFLNVYADFLSVSSGRYETCALTIRKTAYCFGTNQMNTFDNTPRLVTGGIKFASLTGGFHHACGIVDVFGGAVCWGGNVNGQVGSGSFGDTVTSPVSVTGQGVLVYTTVSAGSVHTCGLLADETAWCWGANNSGQLGVAAGSAPEPTALAVTGGLTFTQISAGGNHTCALTGAGAAYCWGQSAGGVLGNDTLASCGSICPGTPTPVLGGHTFRSISAGGSGGLHTCGVTTTDEGYCWGNNNNGDLGTGDTLSISMPGLVLGGHAWDTIAAGHLTTCGLTTTGAAYCWGNGLGGGLGNGAESDETSPVAVSDGHTFTSLTVSASAFSEPFACGVTTAGELYCWGNNRHGQAGGVSGSVPQLVGERP